MPGQKVEVLAGSLGVWGLDQFASCLFSIFKQPGEDRADSWSSIWGFVRRGDERTRGLACILRVRQPPHLLRGGDIDLRVGNMKELSKPREIKWCPLGSSGHELCFAAVLHQNRKLMPTLPRLGLPFLQLLAILHTPGFYRLKGRVGSRA